MAALTGRTLKMEIDAVEYSPQIFEASVDADDADSDEVTFAEAAAGGGRAYVLHLVLTQDMAASTLWSMIWDEAGSDAAVTLIPYGNTVATTDQPHFTMSAQVKEPNGTLIGGEANSSPTARQKVEVDWPLAAKPTRVTA